jgi:hypothetical protein
MSEENIRIYYDKQTGNVIQDVLYSGSIIPKTVEQDINDFTRLSERNRDTFDVIELAYGQLAQDFAECNGYRVNVETKTLEFSYPDPNAPQDPPVFQKSLSEQIKEQKQYTQQLNDDLMSLSDYVVTL